jgi:hypothetical protein
LHLVGLSKHRFTLNNMYCDNMKSSWANQTLLLVLDVNLFKKIMYQGW